MKSANIFAITFLISVIGHLSLFFFSARMPDAGAGQYERLEIRFQSRSKTPDAGPEQLPEPQKQAPRTVEEPITETQPEEEAVIERQEDESIQPVEELAGLRQVEKNESEKQTEAVRHQSAAASQPRAVDQEKLTEEERPSGADRPNALGEYLAQVKADVELNKFYPVFAKQLKLQGSTVVRAHILADGRLAKASVIASSGHESLDRAAKKAVTASAPFDPPSRFGLSDITLDIPVTYKLN